MERRFLKIEESNSGINSNFLEIFRHLILHEVKYNGIPVLWFFWWKRKKCEAVEPNKPQKPSGKEIFLCWLPYGPNSFGNFEQNQFARRQPLLLPLPHYTLNCSLYSENFKVFKSEWFAGPVKTKIKTDLGKNSNFLTSLYSLFRVFFMLVYFGNVSWLCVFLASVSYKKCSICVFIFWIYSLEF